MRNFVQNGNALDLVAPSGGVVAGVGVIIGAIFAVAAVTAAEGETFAGHVNGVFDLDAVGDVSAQDLAVGDTAYFDNTLKAITKMATGNIPVGVVVADKLTAAVIARVRLVPRMAAIAAVLAALTENSGAIGGTNDGNLPNLALTVDLSGWNGSTDPTGAQATAIGAAFTALIAAARENAAKINAIIAALKAEGEVKS